MSETLHTATPSCSRTRSGQWTQSTLDLLTPGAESNMTTIPCYLRTQRRIYGFTQEELAGLIGRGGRERVSGVERAKAQPNAAEILAYSVLFGLSPAELFPAYYNLVEEGLIERAYALDERLLEVKTKEARNKRELLRGALARATGKARNPFRV